MKLSIIGLCILVVGCNVKVTETKTTQSVDSLWRSNAGTLAPEKIEATNKILEKLPPEKVPEYSFDTNLPVLKTNLPNAPTTAFQLEAFQWPTNQSLLQLWYNGKIIVEITGDGEVVYDTNNVKAATRIFWEELATIIREHYTALRKFDERVKTQ